MRFIEAKTLKEGDLVVMDDKQSTRYFGLILEVDSIKPDDYDRFVYVTLKQPGFDGEFRIKDYDSRRLRRYEP